MIAFRFLRGPYLALLGIAACFHVLLAYFAPDPNGYVYDFSSQAIDLLYESGHIPTASECWACYHPPLLPILGAGLFHVIDWFGGGHHEQLFAVALFLNSLSLIFAIYTFSIYQLYRETDTLDLPLWALLLFLPVVFISAFSVEADLLVSTFVVISTYYFVRFLREDGYGLLVLSTVAVALAALSKYSGVVVAAYFGGVLLARYLRYFEAKRLKQGLVFALVVFSIGSYPYFHNFNTTGSPIVGNTAWNTGQNHFRHYNFTSFGIKRVVDVFTDPRELGLDQYPAYNSEVLTSHYGQLWTDFSFYTRHYRHGQWRYADIYKGKFMPVWLIWCVLVAGLIPTIAGFIGLLALVASRQASLLVGMFVLLVALYFLWFLGNDEWMLKTKYLLYLTPLWLIGISKTGSYLPDKVLRAGLVPSIVFSAIYCFYFAVY